MRSRCGFALFPAHRLCGLSVPVGLLIPSAFGDEELEKDVQGATNVRPPVAVRKHLQALPLARDLCMCSVTCEGVILAHSFPVVKL